jgi:hypothetical protein
MLLPLLLLRWTPRGNLRMSLGKRARRKAQFPEPNLHSGKKRARRKAQLPEPSLHSGQKRARRKAQFPEPNFHSPLLLKGRAQLSPPFPQQVVAHDRLKEPYTIVTLLTQAA